jgi:hypothetical protein
MVDEAHVDDHGVDLVLRCSACGDLMLIPSWPVAHEISPPTRRAE